MPEQYEVTDSTDWLATPLAPLAQLESSLRCQVCKDFFTTPMMTSCSHTFCSLCIRRYLSQEGRCPACRDSDQEIKLRRNWVVEELVTNFTATRKALFEFAQSAAQLTRDDEIDSGRPRKRQKVQQAVANGTERRSTRSQSKRVAAASSQQRVTSIPEVIVDSEDEGSMYGEDLASSPQLVPATKEPNDGRVQCPCCGRRMKEAQINSHLDKCITGDSHTPIEELGSLPAQVATPGTIAYGQIEPAKQQSRLPFINYSLLNENSLRKKLRELGIPTHGAKELMRRRHTEWVNLWNANCDSTRPVTKRQLLQDLRIWEDTLGRQIDKAPASSGFMAKDFDRDGHARKQKDNFDDLIRQARQKRALAANNNKETEDSASRQTNGQLPADIEPQPVGPDGVKEDAPLIATESAALPHPRSHSQPQTLPPPSLPPWESTFPSFPLSPDAPAEPQATTQYAAPPPSRQTDSSTYIAAPPENVAPPTLPSGQPLNYHEA